MLMQTATAQEAIISSIVARPDALQIAERVSAIIAEEQRRRLAFYNDVTEEEKAEFIEGEIIVHSPVMKRHNDCLGNIVSILKAYVFEHQLGFIGFEKIMVRLTRNDFEPDLCFFKQEKAKDFEARQTLFPAPDLVVEVLSEGTVARDRGIKYDDYERHGVLEYWIADPDARTIEQYLLDESDKYQLRTKSDSGTLVSRAIEGLVLPIAAVFDEAQGHEFIRKVYR